MFNSESGSFSKCLVLGLALTASLAGVPGVDQQPSATPEPAFDVVSVKQMAPQNQNPVPGTVVFSRERGCQYLLERVLCQSSLSSLIMESYQVDSIRLAAPSWIQRAAFTDTFVVQGTMPGGTSKEKARLMLRQALAERFGLKVHWEKRDIPVYALLPGKHGVKLQPADDPATRKPKKIELSGVGTMKSYSGGSLGNYYAVEDTLDIVADNLWHRGGLDRPVVNMTGLTGSYQFDVRWIPTVESGWIDPGLVTAVQEQLGLRLEKRMLPYDVLVVDHAERTPSAD